jgi:hypothetical protein
MLSYRHLHGNVFRLKDINSAEPKLNELIRDQP